MTSSKGRKDGARGSPLRSGAAANPGVIRRMLGQSIFISQNHGISIKMNGIEVSENWGSGYQSTCRSGDNIFFMNSKFRLFFQLFQLFIKHAASFSSH